mmetsp:Transcript_93004/g.267565  ORF Transcript_93004/g.267565 Transcript_93004/m.267565 type:complete len:250 (+) Transcript_93004:81-830(+)
MAAAAPISARLGVAAACLLPALYAVDAAGIPDLNSCPLQSKCIEWSMTEVPEGDKCTADAVTNAAGESCPGIWKVCMKIRAKGQGKYATCPELMVRSICPNDSLPAADVPQSPIVPAHEACGSPLVLPAGYCRYRAPDDVLKFFVQDGEVCESPDSHGHPEGPHEPDTDCRASVKYSRIPARWPWPAPSASPPPRQSGPWPPVASAPRRARGRCASWSPWRWAWRSGCLGRSWPRAPGTLGRPFRWPPQ